MKMKKKMSIKIELSQRGNCLYSLNFFLFGIFSFMLPCGRKKSHVPISPLFLSSSNNNREHVTIVGTAINDYFEVYMSSYNFNTQNRKDISKSCDCKSSLVLVDYVC